MNGPFAWILLSWDCALRCRSRIPVVRTLIGCNYACRKGWRKECDRPPPMQHEGFVSFSICAHYRR